jgi:hypothetical protein
MQAPSCGGLWRFGVGFGTLIKEKATYLKISGFFLAPCGKNPDFLTKLVMVPIVAVQQGNLWIPNGQ